MLLDVSIDVTNLNSSCKGIVSGFGYPVVSEWENVIEYLASAEKVYAFSGVCVYKLTGATTAQHTGV